LALVLFYLFLGNSDYGDGTEAVFRTLFVGKAIICILNYPNYCTSLGGGPNACIRFCGNFVFNCYFCKRNYIKAAPALNFADENGYVSLYDMLDKESVEYGINIIDHAVAGSTPSAATKTKQNPRWERWRKQQ